jgi:hypothetical protein
MPVICVIALDRSTGTAYYRIKGEPMEQVHSASQTALKFDRPTNRYDAADAVIPSGLAEAKPDLQQISVGYALSDQEFESLKAISSDCA